MSANPVLTVMRESYDDAAHRSFDDTMESVYRQMHEEGGHSREVAGCPLCHPRTLDMRRRHRETARHIMRTLSEVRNYDRPLYDKAMREGGVTA